jgi:hypothetical protein
MQESQKRGLGVGMFRRSLLFAVFFCMLLDAPTSSAFQAPAEARRGDQKLNVSGLSSETSDVINAVYRGRYDLVDLYLRQRDNVTLPLILDGYLKSFGLLCSQFLAPDKVEWVLPRCDEAPESDGGGIECTKRDPIHTHVYVDKNILEVKKQVTERAAARIATHLTNSPAPVDVIRDWIRVTTDPRIRQLDEDNWLGAGKIVVLNGCGSRELKRFQDNLIRFATSQPLLTDAFPLEKPPAVPPRSSPPLPRGLPARHSPVDYQKLDYSRIIEDILHLYPPRSVLHDIDPKSITNPQVVENDDTGLPKWITFTCRVDWAVDPPPCKLFLRLNYGLPFSVTTEKAGVAGYLVDDDIVTRFEAGGYNTTAPR